MAKIVFVEDEPELREDIAETLELAGHTVIQAANGALGLAAILAEKPDLTISDVAMPHMSGHDLLRVLREAHPEFAGMPFVFLSALTSREDQIAGHRLGADNYLTKPVDFELMHMVIDAKLRQAEGLRRLSGAGTMTKTGNNADEIEAGEVYAMIETQMQALSRLLEVVEKIARDRGAP